jgi:hypothetical protein
MPRTSWSLKRRSRAQSQTLTSPSLATTSEFAVIGPSGPPNAQSLEPPQRAYPDYVGGDAGGPRWDAALALPSIVTDISTLPLALAGPFNQVADVVSDTIEILKLMRDNRDECAHLISRVVRFLRSLMDSLKASKVSVANDTPTAASLIALKRYIFHCHCTSIVLKNLFGGSNLMAIRDDTERWSRFHQ